MNPVTKEKGIYTKFYTPDDQYKGQKIATYLEVRNWLRSGNYVVVNGKKITKNDPPYKDDIKENATNVYWQQAAANAQQRGEKKMADGKKERDADIPDLKSRVFTPDDFKPSKDDIEGEKVKDKKDLDMGPTYEKPTDADKKDESTVDALVAGKIEIDEAVEALSE